MTTAAFAMRRATPSDKEDVVALTRAISEHDFVADIYDWWMTATGPDGFYVAEQDGRIIGCYCLEFPGPGQAPWLVYAGLKELPPQPSVRAARPATPADLPDVARFRQETEGGPLAGMIASPDSAWAVRRMTGEDWDVANLVVVPGRNGLDGLMLLSDTEEGLLVRRLDGSPEAAADLLAYAVRRMTEAGQPSLSLGLPLAAEPLLEPLRLDPAEAFRAYLFHLPLSPFIPRS